ncbi:MAG: SelB C-terminal domain-containing protein, partial [Acidimicrobiales bacterium]
ARGAGAGGAAARGGGARRAGARGARVRGLQSHGNQLDRAEPGCRLALNLAGVAHDEVTRGDAVILARQWAPTRVFDASLSALAALSHDIARRGAYQAHLGSGEYPATVRILGGDVVGPGQTGLGRLRIPVALPLLPGDRYVLRESGRAETVGGGEVLDVAPVLPKSRARPDRSVDRVISERGWVEVGLLERLTGERRHPDLAGRWCLDPAARERATAETLAAVREAGPLGLDVAVLDEGRRALAQTLPDLVVEGGRILVAGAQRSADRLAEHPFLAVLEASPFTPPAPDGVDRAELREMARLGLVVECEGIWFAPAALARAAEVLAGLLAEHPEGVTAAQARDALGTTRRWLIPLLGHLDATGVTRRRGDLRVAGPRLPVVQPGALPTHPGPQ